MQPTPEGLAQAFLIGREFVGADRCALALGDNIFYGAHLSDNPAQRGRRARRGATVFGYRVRDPERYGVVEFDADGRAIGLEEKPPRPTSPYAVTGLYFYDNQVLDIAAGCKPSRARRAGDHRRQPRLSRARRAARRAAAARRRLARHRHHESLLQASNFVQAVEERQGQKIACPEEIAYRMGYITAADLERLGHGDEGQRLRPVPAAAAGRRGLADAHALFLRADRRCRA